VQSLGIEHRLPGSPLARAGETRWCGTVRGAGWIPLLHGSHGWEALTAESNVDRPRRVPSPLLQPLRPRPKLRRCLSPGDRSLFRHASFLEDASRTARRRSADDERLSCGSASGIAAQTFRRHRPGAENATMSR